MQGSIKLEYASPAGEKTTHTRKYREPVRVGTVPSGRDLSRSPAESLHISRQPDQAQHKDSVPIHIDFVPGQAVTRRLWMSVVVVVPALAKRQQSHPETVLRIVMRSETLSPPHVRG
jgi:hypothetical protein